MTADQLLQAAREKGLIVSINSRNGTMMLHIEYGKNFVPIILLLETMQKYESGKTTMMARSQPVGNMIGIPNEGITMEILEEKIKQGLGIRDSN